MKDVIKVIGLTYGTVLVVLAIVIGGLALLSRGEMKRKELNKVHG